MALIKRQANDYNEENIFWVTMSDLLLGLAIVFITLFVVGMTCISCDDYETYEQQRDYERSKISSFINNPPMGEIKGQKITVISEAQFLKDTVTDLSKNEFVLFEDGVYMQIVRRGCGSVLKSGESATVISRFKEYNVNGDSLNWWNDAPHQENWYEKYDVTKYSGT